MPGRADLYAAAIGRERGLAEAELAVVAGIETGRNLLTRMALGGSARVRNGAGEVPLRILRIKIDRRVRAGDLATAEAIAAVGRNPAADASPCAAVRIDRSRAGCRLAGEEGRAGLIALHLVG